MTKFLIVLGSPNANGFGAEIINNMKEKFNEFDKALEFDVLKVSETDYKLCKGCGQCFITGQCGLVKEDNYNFYDSLIRYKGIIFLVPSYIHQMPAILKNCFDRMASRMHEFPLLGKKTIVVAYSLSNGEVDLKNYVTGILGSLGCEIIQSFSFNQCRDDYDKLTEGLVQAIVKMKQKVEERKFAVTKSQEQLFLYIKQIVQMELDNKVKSYKQIRWGQLLEYESLVEYLKTGRL